MARRLAKGQREKRLFCCVRCARGKEVADLPSGLNVGPAVALRTAAMCFGAGLFRNGGNGARPAWNYFGSGALIF